MYNACKVIVITMTKDFTCLALLTRLLLPHRDLIDAWHLYIDPETRPYDFARIHQSSLHYPDWIKIQPTLTDWVSKQAQEEAAIYIRLDDSVCYLHPLAILRLLEIRAAYPDPLLVWPATIGQGRTFYIHQTMNKVDGALIGGFKPEQIDHLDLRNYSSSISAAYHKSALNLLEKEEADSLLFGKLFLPTYEPLPLAGSCWYGKGMHLALQEKFSVNDSEEYALSHVAPELFKTPCLIWGQSLIAFLDFETAEELGLWQRYENLGKQTTTDERTALRHFKHQAL